MRDWLLLITLLNFSILQIMKRITIKDLAKLMSLSTSTVSRALSGHPDISESTKKRVRIVAEEFNYTANLHARFFRKNKSGLIALILPEVNMFFSPNLIKSINKTIATSKYSLIVFLSNDILKKEKEIIKQCLSWAVEGVLISLSKETNDLNHLDALTQAEIECVLLDKTLENQHYPTVTIDDTEASYKAVSYLIKNNHQNILGIFGDPNFRISKDRIKGYIKAMEENNLPVLENNMISVNESSDLDSILPTTLKKNNKISAIYTMSDELLVKSHYHINKSGLSIPDNISIISISDGIYPHLAYPKITHVKDSGSKMGRNACKLLFHLIKETTKPINSELFISTKLIELESVGTRSI